MIPKSVATEIDFFPAEKGSLDNVYHIATDKSKPALIVFLEKRQAYKDFIIEDNNRYDEKQLLSDINLLIPTIDKSLKESYDYSSDYLLLLIDEALNNDYLSFTTVEQTDEYQTYLKRLNLLQKLVRYRIAFDKYKKLLLYTSSLLTVQKKTKKLRDIDLEMYLTGKLDIFELIFSNPQPLTLDQLSQLNALIDNSDITFKDEYKLYADRKGYSTSSEIMVYALLALMSSLGDSYSNMLDSQIDLEEDINILQGSGDSEGSGDFEAFKKFKKFKNSLVTVEDKKSLIKKAYTTNAIASLMAQNSFFDKDDIEGKEAKMRLQVINISNEKNINSGVYISNSYELEQELKIANSNMEVAINSINDSNSKLISSTILLTDNQSSIGQSDTDNLILRELNNSKGVAGLLKLSITSLFESISKQASISKAIKEHTSSGNALSSMYSSIIAKRTNFLSLVSTKSSQINLLGINALSSSTINIKGLLDIAGVIGSLKAVQEGSKGLIKNALTLLQNPLELVLSSVNAVLCSLKALQCSIAGVITGLASLGEDLLNLVPSVEKLEQLKDMGLMKLNSLTDKIKSRLTNALTNDFSNKAGAILRDKSNEVYSEIQDKLGADKANKIINAYMTYMEAKIQSVATDLATLTNLTLDCSSAIDGALSDIKSSFENTLANAMSLTNIDSCRPMNFGFDFGFDLPSLDFLIDLKNPFQFNLPDFSIPKIDSKSIKCR